MYKDDNERPNNADRNSEDVYSKPVRAGKRTYFFDVKTTKGNNDYFLTITESKRRMNPDGSFTFDKHKIFLYKEDFDKFSEGLEEVISYLRKNYLTGTSDQESAPAATEANQVDSSVSEEKAPAIPDGAGDSESAKFTDINFEEL